MAEVSDNVAGNASNAPAAINERLLQDFLQQHKTGDEKATTDIQNCTEAQTTDRATIAALSGAKHHRHKVAKLLQSDIAQDRQAAGYGNKPGDDQVNAAQDDAIVALDNRMLSSGAKLTPEQQQALNDDIKAHTLDAKYSREDIPTEQKYVQHDQALLTALKTGKGITEASAAVAGDRNADIGNEDKYIANERAMTESDRRLLKLFGNVELR